MCTTGKLSLTVAKKHATDLEFSMEFMDASLDKLAGTDVPEPVLKRTTACIVKGLKFLKDELQTMHRGTLTVARLGDIC